MKGRTFEFRLIWAYKGRRTRTVLLAQRPARILRQLKRVATDRPWEGATLTSIRKGWVRLALMLDLPWGAVAGLTAQEVMQRIQSAYPAIDFIRVEWRQVGDWTEMLDPLVNLQTGATEAADRRLQQLYDRLAAMTPEELNNWRLLPPNERGDMRPSAERPGHSHDKQRKRNLG